MSLLKRILICARSAIICDNISAMFAGFALEFITLTDGIRARAGNLNDFDVIIVSTPLSNEFGLDLVAELHEKTGSGIVVLTKGEIADEVQAKLKFTGAFVLGRPVNKTAFLQAVKFSRISSYNINQLKNQLKEEKRELNGKIDDLKIINRAKICLVEYLKLTEDQAHRHIQKQAMDTRKTQREVSEEILKIYNTLF